MNGRSPRRCGRTDGAVAGGALVVAAALGLVACEGTNALDPAAPAIFVERFEPAQTGDTALLRRRTFGLAACPLPPAGSALDSSTTIVLAGTPRLQLRLPAGFRVASAPLPTPSMQRIDGPAGERILVERDPATLVAWGPAYATVTDRSIFPCWVAAPTRVSAQLQSFARRGLPFTPSGIVAAVANVPTAVVGGTPLSFAIYARTTERRTQLLALVARLRVAP